MDSRLKYLLVLLMALFSLGQVTNKQNENAEENFIEIPNKIRKIVRFFNETEILQGSTKQNKNENPEKSYEILYIDPLLFTENNRSNKIMERITTRANLGVTYTWARWGKWSKCSRICGGGVQIRKRFCIERRPYGTDMESNSFEPMVENLHKGCVGIYKRYRICNDKECLNEVDRSYRDEQCSTYNDSPFRGKFYDWESYSKDNNECELNCKPIGLNYYATLNKTVIDGTPCKMPAIYYTHFYRRRAVCIEGICKAVHSSGAIRSATTKDSSFKCGSVLCRPVSETFTKENLPKGFLYLTTLSVGASNLSVIQVDKSENFLVLKGADDHFIINGDDEPSTTGIYKYYGNLFDYKKNEDFQTITADGPITRAVDLMILVNGINPGIKYEYYLPIASAGITDSEETATQWNELGVPLDYSDESNQFGDNQHEATSDTKRPTTDKHKRNFMWKLIGFSPCSKSCGGGKQAPIFRCIRDSPTRFYTPRRCMHTEKPVFHDIIYQCNTQPCPAYWFTEDWGDCFCQGNKGTHRRIVKCVQELQGGVAVQVETDQCAEEKPPIKEYCLCPPRPQIHIKTEKARIYEHLRGNVHSITRFKNTTKFEGKHHHQLSRQTGFREDKRDKTGVWLHSDWNQHCSTQCGFGVVHRSIFCDRTIPYTDRCDLINTPDTTRTCKSAINCDIGNWFIGNWSECHGDCFNLYRLRKVICIKANIIVEDEECSLENKPEEKETCKPKDVNYCEGRWHYSDWTECSRPCEGGTQKRFVKCLEIDPIENILRESKLCRYIDREPVYSTCNTHNCLMDKLSLDNQSDEMDNELHTTCTDEFTNCHLISNQNKERLCKLNYYQKNCCRACSSF